MTKASEKSPTFLHVRSNKKTKRTIATEPESNVVSLEHEDLPEPEEKIHDELVEVEDMLANHQHVENESNNTMAVMERIVNSTTHSPAFLDGIDLNKIPVSTLIDIAFRCSQAAEARHREMVEQQRMVGELIGRLASHMGNTFNVGVGAVRKQRSPKHVFRDPATGSLWRGFGIKPAWLKALELKGADISALRETYDPAKHDSV